MRIVAISDTHGLHDGLVIPDGDVLIHAGDLTGFGELDEVERFDAFLATQPHRHKIVIAGNHDWCFQRQPIEARARLEHATYLEDEGVELDGVRFWGSPWQPWFLDWAFNLERGAPIAEKWALIPDDTDVLVTHGPPLSHGDTVLDGSTVGCADLAETVQRIAPRLHIFGHIHEGAGLTRDGTTTYINASICTVRYQPTQPPIIFDL